MNITSSSINILNQNEIFVFGSNRAGAHGAGAARQAIKWGAVYGKGKGLIGSTYALPTKDEAIRTLPLIEIFKEVDDFTQCAINNPTLRFLVTRVGCGLAGYQDSQIAPMFIKASQLSNVYLPIEFWNVINKFLNQTPRSGSVSLHGR